MDWKTIEQEYPEYYQPVYAELSDGRKIQVWRASDGERNIYTIFRSDEIINEDDIVKWKYNV